jgi:DnaA family protein
MRGDFTGSDMRRVYNARPVKQLALDFSVAMPPRLDNFVVGRNAELVQQLEAIAQGRAAERIVYVWGASGSGRTHLLKAFVDASLAAGAAAHYVAGGVSAEFPESLHALDAVAVDDVETLDAAGQRGLFALYNVLRERRAAIVIAGSVPPMRLLELRVDLVTRLGWGLVYEVHALADSEKAAALAEHANARGFALPDDIARYLLTHSRRDMPALLAILDALDRYSLEAKRPITVPLLRELLAETNQE